jgi:hypothetical protein
MVDFEQIRIELVKEGLAHEDMANSATQKIVFVEGEWNRDGSASIKKRNAGWVVGDFSKTLPACFDVPDTSNFKKEPIATALQSMFPDAKIIVKIQ